ncbi:MAG: hypothetical protein AB8H79_00070 [Myxococcota bacterium]
MRQLCLLALITPLMGSECTPPTGPSKYGPATITDLRLTPGRLCDDPAGAAIEIRGTYSITCTADDQCGRDLGKTFSVEMVIDGRAPFEEQTLENGDLATPPADCTNLTAQFTGTHPVDGPGRDLGGLQPDCTIGLNGPSVAEIEDVSLEIAGTQPDLAISHSCPGPMPYGVLEPTTIIADTTECTDGAVWSVGGQGQVLCRDGSRCTEGELLTFSYTLGPQGVPPEIELSNGETLHLPYSCVDAQMEVRGFVDGARKQIGRVTEACVLNLDEEKLARATDVRVEGGFGWLPEVSLDAACP